MYDLISKSSNMLICMYDLVMMYHVFEVARSVPQGVRSASTVTLGSARLRPHGYMHMYMSLYERAL